MYQPNKTKHSFGTYMIKVSEDVCDNKIVPNISNSFQSYVDVEFHYFNVLCHILQDVD